MMEADRDPVTLDEQASTSDQPPASDSPPDPAFSQRVLDPQVRRRLTRELGVDVVIDRTGWLRSGVELVFTRHSDGSLEPERFRIGSDASEEDAQAEAEHMLLHVARYNAVLHRLRQLAARLAEARQRQPVTRTSDAATADAHRQLAQLDQWIARRQAITMVRGIVGSIVLVAESEFLMRCEAQLAPGVALVTTRTPNKRPSSAFASLRRRLCTWFGNDQPGNASVPPCGTRRRWLRSASRAGDPR